MHSAYNEIAWFYNKYWTEQAPELFEKVLNKILLPNIPTKGDILDLCCGTGQMCARLSRRLYNMTGLDRSEQMLAIARENAPSTEFVQGDATCFNLSKEFDAVISIFDSMNHLMSLEDLRSCFKSVKAVLKTGSYFFFDVNDILAFNDSWEAGFSMVEKDNVCIMKPVYDPHTKKAAYKITAFRLEDGSWKRTDATVYETYFSRREITKALYDAGFYNVQALEGYEDVGVEVFKDRIFFLAS